MTERKAWDIPCETWHGTQNRFALVEESSVQELNDGDRVALAIAICSQLGTDGLLIVKPLPSNQVKMILYNADGSRAQMCGNGVRCVAAYSLQRGWVEGPEFVIEADAGPKTIKVIDSQFKVNMGPPILDPERIPVNPTSITPAGIPFVMVSVREEGWDSPLRHRLDCVSMGNPHAVLFVSEHTTLKDVPLEKWGPQIETSDNFTERTNFEVALVGSEERQDVYVRVWERGVGETQACGTGACAVVVVGIIKEFLRSPVTVHLPGGVLTIEWGGKGDVFMTGPAEKITETTLRYPPVS